MLQLVEFEDVEQADVWKPAERMGCASCLLFNAVCLCAQAAKLAVRPEAEV